MKKYIVIIMACVFIIVNEFEDVAAQNDFEGFVERFELFYWVTLFLYNFLNKIVMTMSIAVCTRIFVQSCQTFLSPQNLIETDGKKNQSYVSKNQSCVAQVISQSCQRTKDIELEPNTIF